MRRFVAAAAIALLTVPLASAAAFAQGATRAGTYELSAGAIYTEASNYGFLSGASAKTDAAFGLGIQWAYNFNEHFAAGIDGAFSGADYQGVVTPAAGNNNAPFTYNGRLETTTLRVSGIFNFSSSQFTPFVTAGFGMSWVDTNIPTGPSQPVCWYYPYYGEICTDATPTKVTSNFSYNTGAGLRYDMRPDPYFIRLLYNVTWVDMGGAAGTIPYYQIRFDFGTKF